MPNSMMLRRLAQSAKLVFCLGIASMAAGLGGCGSMIADLPIIGLPADAPPRKSVQGYVPVNDLPPDRETAKMETAEQLRLRAELAAAREKQAAAAAAAAK